MILDPAPTLTTTAIAIAVEIPWAAQTATRGNAYPDPRVAALAGGPAAPKASLKSVNQFTEWGF